MTAAQAVPRSAATPPTPSRMTLAGVVKGKQQAPIRALLYGVEGIGKSTFGANAPNPIFLGAEDGTAHLDVARFPRPETWADVRDAIRVLTHETHEYRTLVLDTVDWVEPLIWSAVCRRDGMENIEAYGFGKGYNVALDEWRLFVSDLERLVRAKPMNVLLLAHSWIRPFKNPEGEDYDRYELKLHAKAGGLLKEWVDHVLFANYETFAKKDNRKRVRGVDTGARLIFTTRRAAFDAKHRGSLPETIPLGWADFVQALERGQPAVEPTALTSEIHRKAKLLGGDNEKQALAAVERAAGDVSKLELLNNWVNARLVEAGKEA